MTSRLRIAGFLHWTPAFFFYAMLSIIMLILEKFLKVFYLPKLRKLDKEIGCEVVFGKIPDEYINGIVHCDMTKTWKDVGLNIEKGSNYFTIGRVEKGDSSRFDKNSIEYQSWLGAYTVKLGSGENWNARDHFRLAIADQNSWLRWYGDPHPMTSIEDWNLNKVGEVKVGDHTGELFEFGCTTHSDEGKGFHSLKLFFASIWLAAEFNLSNPKLHLKAKALRPTSLKDEYKILKLDGYIAIFNIKENVKVVFYGNGARVHREGHVVDTFEKLKKDLLKTIESAEIISL